MGKNESIYLGAGSVENINSTKYEDFLRDIYPVSVVSKLDYLMNVAIETPLYFVNKELIDLLCPPKPKIRPEIDKK
ncbi:MAG: hypothetical protein N2712_00965 [Brevinematales bacterium]|nr:hypothetical protein [Brevinematales bacterium]